MKKIVTITTGIIICFAANAQDDGPQLYGPEVFRVVASIFVVGMFMYFIINIMRRLLEHRLKNKIIDKGISENIAHSILEARTADDRNANVKWFAILAGLGIGLLGVNYTQPLGFHSLAIMAFSISISFLGYYLFIRNAGK